MSNWRSLARQAKGCLHGGKNREEIRYKPVKYWLGQGFLVDGFGRNGLDRLFGANRKYFSDLSTASNLLYITGTLHL
jgi:hypothetical protein